MKVDFCLYEKYENFYILSVIIEAVHFTVGCFNFMSNYIVMKNCLFASDGYIELIWKLVLPHWNWQG